MSAYIKHAFGRSLEYRLGYRKTDRGTQIVLQGLRQYELTDNGVIVGAGTDWSDIPAIDLDAESSILDNRLTPPESG